MSVESEVPVPVCDLEVHTVEELWRCALSRHVTVIFRDGPVAVQVLERVLDRSPVRVESLLVGVVCIWRIAHHLPAEIASGAFGDVSGLDIVVLILGRVEPCELCVLECAVEAHLDAPVRFLYRYGADRELKSLVADRADVGHELVAEIRAHRHLHRVQKITGVAYVRIDASAEAFVEEAVVQTDIVCHGRLPSYRRVICLRSEVTDVSGSSHIVQTVRVVGALVAGEMDIIPDAVLLTCKTGRESQLEG